MTSRTSPRRSGVIAEPADRLAGYYRFWPRVSSTDETTSSVGTTQTERALTSASIYIAPMLRRRPTIREKARRVERAFADMIEALGYSRRKDLRRTPRRAAQLWLECLVPEEKRSLAELFDKSPATRHRHPVILRNLGVFMVCPHHLTVAFGHADVGYVPSDRLAGLGSISALAAACTAGLVLQEDATQKIVDALLTHLHARAAVVHVLATHPCHNLPLPRSHAATCETWAEGGAPSAINRLCRLMQKPVAQRRNRGNPGQ